MPKLYIHRESDVVTNGIKSTTTITRLESSRLDTEQFECFFHDGDTAVALEEGSAGLLVVKKAKDQNGQSVLYVPEWVEPPTTRAGYSFSLLVASAGLNTALGSLSEVSLVLQIVWTENDKRHSTPPIEFVVRQTYWLGTEEVPVPDPPFPLPGAILTKAGNLQGIADPVAARAALSVLSISEIANRLLSMIGEAFISVEGNNSTGIIGDPTRPFRTGDAALDAGVDVEYLFCTFGPGKHDKLTDDAIYGGPGSLNPDSKLRDNLVLRGAGQPNWSDDLSHLVGGTIITGHLFFDCSRRNVQILDLGVDSGPDVKAALYPATDIDAFCVANIGQIDPSSKPPSPGWVFRNLTCLGPGRNLLTHAFVSEGTKDAVGDNIRVANAYHGRVIKSDGGNFANCFAYKCGSTLSGGGGDATIIKSDEYAICRNVLDYNARSQDCTVHLMLQGGHGLGLPGISAPGGLCSGVLKSPITLLGGQRIRNVSIELIALSNYGVDTPDGEPNVSISGEQLAVADLASIKVNGNTLAYGQTPGASVIVRADGWMELPVSDDFIFAGDNSIAALVSQSDDWDGNPRFICSSPALGINVFATNRVIAVQQPGSNIVLVQTGALGWIPNKDYWIVVTRIGNVWCIYRNGVLVATNTSATSITARTNAIGNNQDLNRPLTGPLKRFVVYKGVGLTRVGVAEIQNLGRTVDETGCKFRADFSASAGTTVIDATGAHDATLHDSAFLIK